MAKHKKELTYVRGYFVELSEIEIVQTKEGLRQRATMTLETEDGQIIFLEIRDTIEFDKIDEFNLHPDDALEVGFVFVGVKSFNKYFNNLHVKHLDLI